MLGCRLKSDNGKTCLSERPSSTAFGYSSSFISEHTAEFILAPRAVEAFSSHASTVVPIYFWSTREGSRLSRSVAANTRLQMVSIFARRPKVDILGSDKIAVNLNEELFDYTDAASALGIPTLAGIPLVSSLDQLRLTSPCAWFRLRENAGHGVEILLDLHGENSGTDSDSHVICSANLGQLAKDAVAAAKCYEWVDALDTLRILRRTCGPSGCYPYYGGYRPFHLLLLQ